MPEIRNVSPVAITVPSIGVTVEPGESVTVDAVLADELTARAEWRSGSSKAPTVAEVLAEVGDDPARAQAALDAEQARGNDARKTLVADLAAIIEAAPAEED